MAKYKSNFEGRKIRRDRKSGVECVSGRRDEWSEEGVQVEDSR